MKRFLARFAGSILMLLVGYGLVVSAVGLLNLEHRIPNTANLTGEFDRSLLRFREAETHGPVDVVFIGSSHTYRGFDPCIFEGEGIRAFNLGTSAQTPLNSYRLLARYLPKLKPRVVVIESYWGIFESTNGKEASMNIVCNTPASWDFLGMALQSTDVRTVNTTLANYAKRLRQPLETAPQLDFGNDTYVNGGYSETTRPPVSAATLKALRPYRSHIEPIQMRYLQQMVELCYAHGATPVLVRTPVTLAYFNNLQNLQEVTQPLQDSAQRWGIGFHDFSEDVQSGSLPLIDTAHYYDKNHLAQSGVAVFNPYFIRWMRQQGLLEE